MNTLILQQNGINLLIDYIMYENINKYIYI